MARPKLFSFFGSNEPSASVALPVIPAAPSLAVPSVEALALAAVTAERDSNAAALAALTAEADTLLASLATAETERAAFIEARDALTAERDALTAQLATDRAEITAEIRTQELAGLAASQGIPAADIPPVAVEAAQTREEKLAALAVKLEACTDPSERFQIGKEASKLSR